MIPMKAKNLISREVSFSRKSIFPGSQISREVKFPGKSNFTEDIHDVHISAIYDIQLRLMRKVMKYADGRTDGRRTTQSDLLP